MFKEGEENQRKFQELRSEYLKLKTRVGTEFIIKTRHNSDATANLPH